MMRRPGQMPQKSMKSMIPVLKRVIGIIMKHYGAAFIGVIALIMITAYCTLQGTLFMQQLIDGYITPMETYNTSTSQLISENLTDQTISDAAADPAQGTAKAAKQLAAKVAETRAKELNPEQGFPQLWQALMKLAIVLVIGILANYLHSVLTMYISQGTMRKMRDQLFTTMEKLPIRYFDTHSHGDIMSLYTNDIDTLRQLIGQSIPGLLDSAITIVVTFVSMIMMSWMLTGLSVLMIVITMLVSAKLAGKAGKNFVAQQRNLGRVNGFIEEMMTGQKVVKVFCHEEKAIEEFEAINEDLRVSATQANSFSNIIGPVNNNLSHLSYVLCAVVGAAVAIATKGVGPLALSLGSLVTFLSLNKNFSRPISQVSMQMSSIVMAAAGAQRVFEAMDTEPEDDNGDVLLVNARENADGSLTEVQERTGVWAWKHVHGDGTVSLSRQQGGVVFEHVDFGYVPEKTVLHDISLYAHPGQKIAFVGGTGAGKTTITNLINRFYDIQSGKIRYDGENIGRIKKDDLRRSLGIVLQDTHLFTGTVMENIRYGRLDASDEDCIKAAKLANADGFIRRLPNGYETMLTGDGANLSQGQRQLLAIARAAVADPPCLILDEATSSIDTRTEALVQRGMDALMKDRTTFVIAHRLSTVRNSDCIMVLEQGRIIERGTHDELIEQKGKYYQLYTGNAISE